MDEATRLQRHLPLFRACAGWTAKNFAELLEVSRQTVSAWENYNGKDSKKGVKHRTEDVLLFLGSFRRQILGNLIIKQFPYRQILHTR